MRQRIIATAGVALILATTYTVAGAADQCPELSQAKATLNSGKASLKKGPRALAGAKQEDVQSPRGQDIQSPRSQQGVPVPRGQQIQAPRVAQAEALVKESQAACDKGDRALSARKANEALKLLKP